MCTGKVKRNWVSETKKHLLRQWVREIDPLLTIMLVWNKGVLWINRGQIFRIFAARVRAIKNN